MMKYFRLLESTNLKEIGKFPQCSGKFVSNWNSNNSLVLVFKKKVASNNIEIPEFILNDKAKRTDLLSTSFLDFMLAISTKLKKLIESKNYEGVQFFKSALHCKNAIAEEYWILNPFGFRNEYIDFNSSTIKRSDSQGVSYLKVKDRSEFDGLVEGGKQENKIHVVSAPKLYSDKIKEDFFLLDGVDGGIGYYVSEAFKNEITEAGCTGIAFSEI